MSKRKVDSDDQAPTELFEAGARSSGPKIEARSVLQSLDGEGLEGSGLKLEDLEEEAPLPELQMGSEKYSILKELGSGGMGKVYLAFDRDLKRRVALKMVRAEGTRQVRRFLEEAQVMAQLDHPNIVPVFEVGLTTNKKPYYTMRVVAGRTLTEVIKLLKTSDPEALRKYSLARRMRVFVELGQALAYAHARGVIHRDLKPANVMLGYHGEVQVMDWGLSKVFRAGTVETSPGPPLTKTGNIIGTPWYMSPEQARDLDVDHRTDIYSLGVILYELLTLTQPFRGEPMEVIAAILRDPPEPPRSRAAERDIPLELEKICLAALAKSREERTPSVEVMLAEVETWLEAEADTTKRRALAMAKAEEGRARLDAYRQLKEDVVKLGLEAKEVAARFESWQPVSEKAELFAAEDRVVETSRLLNVTATDVVGVLGEALAFDAANATARGLLADYYWDRFVDAEARNRPDAIEYFSRLVGRYHDGRYARELTGDGSLEVSTEPGGATVKLYELVEEGPILMERRERQLGAAPVSLPLAMGSYLAILSLPGYRDVRYPVFISRNHRWSGVVKLYREDEIGEPFVYIPAGPFIYGGDEGIGRSGPRVPVSLPDYFIMRHPVTMTEYLEYLNELVSSDGPEVAFGRSPRAKYNDPKTSYLHADDRGFLVLPEVDSEGDHWDPRMPAFGISWYDAVAYCEWRSARDGRIYRLPSEREWEKAARGVDGRWYPWGYRFDASLANMRTSRRERTAPVAVDEFPTDVSIYGVRGTAGNVEDWTSTEVIEGMGDQGRPGRVARGGTWNGHRLRGRCSSSSHVDPTSPTGNRGFRMAFSPPGQEVTENIPAMPAAPA